MLNAIGKSRYWGAISGIGAAAAGLCAAGCLFYFAARGLNRWLPADYSVHGRSIDLLFRFIFWVTFVVFVAVELVLAWFLLRYRRAPQKAKARYIHGHTRLEMYWTLVPAAIFVAIAAWSKQVWDAYRYSPLADDPRLVRILVIGEQFKWNVIYPGPDGKLGRYLVYPKVTDLAWPKLPPGATFEYPSVPGPAYLPEDKARAVLDAYVSQINPLGKDFDDPDGRDDLWQSALGRPLEIPKGRPIEIELSSKDVIHGFFLPNFRVKLDAVPGMLGKLFFMATRSSAEFEAATRRAYSLDELDELTRRHVQLRAVVTEKSKGANHDRGGWRYKLPGRRGATIVRNEGLITDQLDPDTGKTIVQELRQIGVDQIEAYIPKYWELVCEQLCGQGHYTMEDQVIVLEDSQFRQKYESPGSTP